MNISATTSTATFSTTVSDHSATRSDHSPTVSDTLTLPTPTETLTLSDHSPSVTFTFTLPTPTETITLSDHSPTETFTHTLSDHSPTDTFTHTLSDHSPTNTFTITDHTPTESFTHTLSPSSSFSRTPSSSSSLSSTLSFTASVSATHSLTATFSASLSESIKSLTGTHTKSLTVLPEEEEKTKHFSESAEPIKNAAGLVSLVTASPVGVMNAQRLGGLSLNCNEEFDLHPRQDVAPIPFSVGDSDFRFYFGGSVFACILFAGGVFLHMIIAFSYALCKQVPLARIIHTSKLSLPATALFLMIGEPIGQLGLVSATQGARAFERAIGSLMLIIYAVTAVSIFTLVLKVHFQPTLVPVDEEELNKKCCLVRRAMPTGEYMAEGRSVELLGDDAPHLTKGSVWWMSMFTPLYVDYSERFRYWLALEVFVAFFLGIIEALNPFIGCKVGVIFMFLLLLSHTVCAFVLRPFLIPLDRALNWIISPLMSIAGLCKVFFVFTEDDALADMMEWLIVILSALLLLRSFFDIFSLIRKAFKSVCGCLQFKMKQPGYGKNPMDAGAGSARDSNKRLRRYSVALTAMVAWEEEFGRRDEARLANSDLLSDFDMLLDDSSIGDDLLEQNNTTANQRDEAQQPKYGGGNRRATIDSDLLSSEGGKADPALNSDLFDDDLSPQHILDMPPTSSPRKEDSLLDML